MFLLVSQNLWNISNDFSTQNVNFVWFFSLFSSKSVT